MAYLMTHILLGLLLIVPPISAQNKGDPVQQQPVATTTTTNGVITTISSTACGGGSVGWFDGMVLESSIDMPYYGVRCYSYSESVTLTVVHCVDKFCCSGSCTCDQAMDDEDSCGAYGRIPPMKCLSSVIVQNDTVYTCCDGYVQVNKTCLQDIQEILSYSREGLIAGLVVSLGLLLIITLVLCFLVSKCPINRCLNQNKAVSMRKLLSRKKKDDVSISASSSSVPDHSVPPALPSPRPSKPNAVRDSMPQYLEIVGEQYEHPVRSTDQPENTYSELTTSSDLPPPLPDEPPPYDYTSAQTLQLSSRETPIDENDTEKSEFSPEQENVSHQGENKGKEEGKPLENGQACTRSASSNYTDAEGYMRPNDEIKEEDRNKKESEEHRDEEVEQYTRATDYEDMVAYDNNGFVTIDLR